MILQPGRAFTGRALRLALVLGSIVLLQLDESRAEMESTTEPATRLPELAVEAGPFEADDPQTSSFAIDEKLLAGRGRITLADALRNAPGVLLQEHFGGFEPARISIRGSGLQSAPLSRGLNFLLDGLPLNLADGSFNGVLVNPALADQVAVARSPAGAGDAVGVLGGAIELRGPARATNALTAVAQAGSFGLIEGTLAAHSSRPDLALDATADVVRQDGYRDHAAQSRSGLFVRARRPNPAGAETTVGVYHTHAAYDVPGPLLLAAAASNPRSISSDVLRDQPRRVSEGTRLSLQSRQQNPDLAVEFGASWLHTTDWFRQLAANGISTSNSDDLALRAGVVRRLELASTVHRARGSVDYLRGWRDVRRYVNDRGATGRLFGDDGLRATTFSAQAEDTVELSSTFNATVGVTGLAVRRDVDDRTPVVSGTPRTSQLWSASAIQPRAGIAWARTRNFRFRAGVSRAAEPPTFDDLLFVSGTPPNLQRRSQRLATQRATTWELGATGRRARIEWDLTAYTADWSNEILRLADARGLPRGAVNASPTRHQGIEALVRWSLIDGPQQLQLVAAGTWSRFTFVDDAVLGRNRLAGLPPHQGSAELQYENKVGPFAAVGGDWTAGATAVDHAGRMSYGGHAIATLRSGWRSLQGWRVYLEVRNLFNRGYISSTAGVLDVARNPSATSIFLPGVGRSVLLRLEWTFR